MYHGNKTSTSIYNHAPSNLESCVIKSDDHVQVRSYI